MNSSEINVTRLKNIFVDNPIGKLALEYFDTLESKEEEEDKVVTVEDLQVFSYDKRGAIAIRQDVVDLFKALEEVGVGEFVVGRRTQKSRFASRFSLIDIVQTVQGASDTEKVSQVREEMEVPQEASQDVQEIEGNQNPGKGEVLTSDIEEVGKFLTYSFPLRPNLVINLNLPVDLTDSEAERLSRFIKTLPFNG